MATTLILPCPSLSPTEQAERAISDLLTDLDRTEDLIAYLDGGTDFDASIEIRTARTALLRALQAVNQPALVEVL